MKNKLIVLLIVVISLSCQTDEKYHLQSPNASIQLEVSLTKSNIFLTQSYNGDIMISTSPIGLMVNGIDLTKNVKITRISETSIDQIWQTVNGKNKEVRNNYKEYILKFESERTKPFKYQMIFRIYNEGFAYRYHIPEQPGYNQITISKERTQLNLEEDFKYWAYNKENHNIGPLTRSLTTKDTILPPMVIETKKGSYISIQEAEIIRHAPFNLQAQNKDNTVNIITSPTTDKLPLITSWRSFIIGDHPGDLVESNLLVNLNAPCKIDDTSWIKPGKSLWDWRVWGYKATDGFEYGLNTISHKRMIDFASENNIQNLLIDADWYGPEFSEDSNPTNAREGVDIEACMSYAREKGVGIILYLNDVGAKKFGLEKVLKQFSEWGAVGVKYGFMKADDMQRKVRHTRRVVELCAKYRLMVDFHDKPIPPSGDRRTWPNLITKEYGHAQADAKRSYLPKTGVNTALINMITGPIDMTNGWFDLNHAHNRERVFQEIPGTVAAEVAKLIVVYTGWMVLPDSPEAYLQKDDLFDCIRKMPAQFDSFQILEAKIDQYISVARQSGEDWFVGTLTNEEARDIEIDLSFLLKDQTYKATFYEDAQESHYLNNKESYKIKTEQVKAGDKLIVHLAAGGGNAIYFTKNN